MLTLLWRNVESKKKASLQPCCPAAACAWPVLVTCVVSLPKVHVWPPHDEIGEWHDYDGPNRPCCDTHCPREKLQFSTHVEIAGRPWFFLTFIFFNDLSKIYTSSIFLQFCQPIAIWSGDRDISPFHPVVPCVGHGTGNLSSDETVIANPFCIATLFYNRFIQR